MTHILSFNAFHGDASAAVFRNRPSRQSRQPRPVFDALQSFIVECAD